MTKSINSPDFKKSFIDDNHVVGLIGYGYIGKAVHALFDGFFDVKIYDVANKNLGTLEDVVKNSSVIFVAVPTPMNKDGSCHTDIVESVLKSIQDTAISISRDVEEFIVVIKSTVPPGFTEKMSEKHALRIVFSPEFLTEKDSIGDFKFASRLVLGGAEEDSEIVRSFFVVAWSDRIQDERDSGLVFVFCDSTTAELVKYFTNVYLTTIVMFANEFYNVCKNLGVDYDTVKEIALLDRRISHSHLNVPGHDGSFGFGGSCFPKDINSLKHICNQLGINERLFSAIIERNNELRPSRDWEELKGRAVV